MKNKVSILGQDYQIIICSQDEMNNFNPRKRPSDNALNCWGLCDPQKKIIYIDSDLLDDVPSFNRVLRHEILHSFAYESGQNFESEWGQNEECIDYYAIQYPKIVRIFDKLGIGGR